MLKEIVGVLAPAAIVKEIVGTVVSAVLGLSNDLQLLVMIPNVTTAIAPSLVWRQAKEERTAIVNVLLTKSVSEDPWT